MNSDNEEAEDTEETEETEEEETEETEDAEEAEPEEEAAEEPTPAPVAPVVRRKTQTATPAAPVKPTRLTVDLGGEVFIHQGTRYGPGVVQFPNNDKGARVHGDLTNAKKRADKAVERRMKVWRREGIINPAPAPIHSLMEMPEEGDEE